MITHVFILIFLTLFYVHANQYPSTCIISGHKGIIRFDHSDSTQAHAAESKVWWFQDLSNEPLFAITGATNGEYFMFGSQSTMDIWKVKNDRSSGTSTDDNGWKTGINNENIVAAGVPIAANSANYPATASSNTRIWSMAYATGLDMWLASTYMLSIFYSENDGSSWTYSNLVKGSANRFTSTETSYIHHIYYNEAKFIQYGINELVAVGNQGCVFVSNDGKSWTGIKCLSASNHGMEWVTYAKGRYIIASFDGKIYYSSKDRTLSSSTTWHESTVVQATISGVTGTVPFSDVSSRKYSVHYAEETGRIVIGMNGCLMYSDLNNDVIEWHLMANFDSNGGDGGKQFQTVGYYNDIWWAFGGNNGAGKLYYWTSTDNGENWNKNELTNNANQGLNNNFGGGGFTGGMSVTCNVPPDKCSLTRDFWDVDNCCTDFSDSSCTKCEQDYKLNDCCPYRGL